MPRHRCSRRRPETVKWGNSFPCSRPELLLLVAAAPLAARAFSSPAVRRWPTFATSPIFTPSPATIALVRRPRAGALFVSLDRTNADRPGPPSRKDGDGDCDNLSAGPAKMRRRVVSTELFDDQVSGKSQVTMNEVDRKVISDPNAAPDYELDCVEGHDEEDNDAASLGRTAKKDYTAINPTLEVLLMDPSAMELVSSHVSLPNDYKRDMTSPYASAGSKVHTSAGGGAQNEHFVPMFRSSANYLAKHRNTVMVLHLPGGLLKQENFHSLIDDIALMWLLGVDLIICVGCRNLIAARLAAKGNVRDTVNGIRITDKDTLRIVKEEAGFVRFEVERQLARALRNGSHLSESGEGGNVVSGNFFSAKPIGVRDGIDYEYTGILRRVEIEKIRRAHAANDVVVLTTLGVSPSGELFSVNSECLAAGVAGAMKASKLIFLSEEGTMLRHKETSKPVHTLRLEDARRLLSYNGFDVMGNFAIKYDATKKLQRGVLATFRKICWSLSSLRQGVKRAHIIPPSDGSLLSELYTRDGSGLLISRDLYDGIRRAVVEDIPGICAVIRPLIDANVLVDRPANIMEEEIDTYYVFIRDDLVVGCGQVKIFGEKYAEIGCLVIAKEYRQGGRGDALFGYLERLCCRAGVTTIFVLSTQTMQWFLERGFYEVGVEALPEVRQASYNHERKSKIYIKKIENERDLDAEELMWDR